MVVLGGTKTPRARDVRAALRTIPQALRLAWEADRNSTIGMSIVSLIAALIPSSQAWVGKLIVDSVVQAIDVGLPVQEGLRLALPFLLLEFALITLGAVFNEYRTLLERILSTRLRHSMNMAIIDQALGLDLHYFENAEFYDKLQNARNETDYRAMTLLETSFMLFQQILTLISIIAILVTFSPLLALLLIVATFPALLVQMRYSDVFYTMQTMRAPEARRMNYLEHLLTVDSSIKEIKLFGLGKPLLKQYERLFWKFYDEDIGLARWRGIRSLLWGLVATSSYYIAYAWIVWRTIQGGITLGDMTLYLTLFRQTQMTVQELFGHVGKIYESGLFLENLFGFLRLKPQIASSPGQRRVARPIQHGIEFRGVSFRYPNRPSWALRDVNLFIRPGEKLALVGPNGAGKTTLVKLLTRLYDPTEGQILLDGVDLREYDLEDLRRCIGVIFQDFVRYHATARENIGYGQIDKMDDTHRIVAAAERGGADEVIDRLPQGYETMLGTWFERGSELSGGQWQKIALGRAFMREGEVLVLDEPTAALDARREFDIFMRFRDLTAGKIALLISHRFSTVRMADRIAVLEDGRLSEYGTHDELIEHDGTYAELFHMQAQGYR
jgi:ATP-binding cassette subfamily B protein